MELPALGKTPISEENPSGKDVRYEPDFEALSHEIAKLGSPTAGSTTDWDKVKKLSVSILETQSKHLQVATYYTYSQMKTEGLDGFFKGVHVLRDILENFWDTMFPPKKRMKGRRGIVEWWLEKTKDFISDAETISWKGEKRDQLIDDLSFMDEFLGENMDNAPLFRPLINQIKSVIEAEAPKEPSAEESLKPEKPETTPGAQAPKESPPSKDGPEPETTIKPPPLSKETLESTTPKEPSTASKAVPETSSPAPEKPVVKTSPAPGTVGTPFSETSADTDTGVILKQGLSLLGKSVSALRQQNFFDPTPYRLSRLVAWTPIDDVPSATGGKTMLPPPDGQIISTITSLYNASNWQELVDACESRVKQYLFWLDLSRYVVQAMEQLGHPEISDVIDTETHFYVKRLKGIEILSFSDGTPFADGETREWLKGLGRGKESSMPDIGSDGPGSLKEKVRLGMHKAQKLIKEQKTDTALSMIMERQTGSVSGREKFLWKLELCRVLINSKHILIASSYIDDIINGVEKYHLEKWEPDIAVDALSLVLKVLRLQQKEEYEPLIESTIKRISILDPLKALNIV